MANNGENDKPVVRKTWTMIKRAVRVPKYTEGMQAHWDGFQPLNSSNQWVDVVNGYTFTPVTSSAVPVHQDNLLNFTKWGGMKSSLRTPATSVTPYTLEITLRDTYSATPYLSDNYGTIIDTGMDSDWISYPGIHLRKFVSKVQIFYRNSSWKDPYGYVNIAKADFVPNGLDTFTFVPTKGIYRNGVCLQETPDMIMPEEALGIGTYPAGSYASYYKLKFKVHSVRYYPFELTEEQIKQNYETDKYIYGE